MAAGDERCDRRSNDAPRSDRLPQISALRREAEKERRPHVFVQVFRGKTSQSKEAVYLSFTNYGKTPAKNVRATFPGGEWKAIGNRVLAFERDTGILLLRPQAEVEYFIGPANSALWDFYGREEGVEVLVNYSSSTSDAAFSEIFQLSVLDRYGSKSASRLESTKKD